MDCIAYPFDHPHAASPAELVKLLGGKGAGLARLTRLGIPVPPGFTVATQAYRRLLDDGDGATWLDDAVLGELARLEKRTGQRLGDGSSPLLVAVRSGAAQSMPGMMDTVLNVGMTPEVAAGLAAASGDPEFARDVQRRAAASFNAILGEPPPADPREQLLVALRSVFRSWAGRRATAYREREGIDHSLGTAATVQAMVFGNLGKESGTGVVFSRDPATGERGLAGDFLPGAQGEDVVAGTHATLPLSALRRDWPDAWSQLEQVVGRLEHEYGDMVDVEFTLECGRLWILQCRPGKRSPRAAFKIAVDLAENPSFALDRAGAVAHCAPYLSDPPTAPPAELPVATAELARGLAASPGRGVGILCTEVDDALARADAGEAVILARRETSPADVAAIGAAAGLVTQLGGMVSHAAVVARAWGIPAVVGVPELDLDGSGVSGPGGNAAAGDVVTVDGDRGILLHGAFGGTGAPLPEVETIRSWAAEVRTANWGTVGSGAPVVAQDDLLRLIELKGLAEPFALAEALGATAANVAAPLVELEREGLVSVARERRRATESGVARVRELFAAETRRALPTLGPLLEDFQPLNAAFKELIAAWQLREIGGQQVPNEHDDPDYDRAILARLRDQTHPAIRDLLERAASALPRLAQYRRRFDAALTKIAEGDRRYVAHPLVDSWHTVWFELHEELIRLAGRTRASEAAAGRG